MAQLDFKPSLISFAKPECKNPQLVGGKASSLATLTQHGFPVPSGFVLTTAAFQSFCEHNKIRLDGAPERVRYEIKAGSLPEELLAAIRDALSGAKGEFAVRSSAVGEDGASSSMAGQLDTFLEVSPSDVPERVKDCWAALFGEPIRAYRERHGLDVAPEMAVVVQKLVKATYAGVLYTFDPQHRSADHLVLEWVEGLGEALVAGKVTPERLRIRRKMRDIPTHLPENLAPALAQLTEHALTCERLYGCPLDIEWAVDDSGVWLLQARPITAVVGEHTVLWSNANMAENFPLPLAPFTRWTVDWFYSAYMRSAMKALNLAHKHARSSKDAVDSLVGFHRGRAYYNLNSWYRVADDTPFADRLKGFFDHYVGQDIPLRPRAAMATAPAKADLGWKKWRDTINFGLNATWKLATLDQRLVGLERELASARRKWRKEPKAPRSLEQLGSRLKEHHSFLDEAWEPAALADFAVMVFPSLLQKICETWFDDRDRRLLPGLLRGLTVKSTEPSDLLMEIARLIVKEPQALELLKALQYQELEQKLPASIRAVFDDFLARFGGRCYHEAMLTSPTFEERTDLVWDLVGSYTHMAENVRTDRAEQQVEERDLLIRSCLAQLSPWRRLAFQFVLKETGKAIARRERGRLCQSLLFGEIRRSTLAIGERMKALGLLEDSNDVFFLEGEEIDRLVSGRFHYPDLLKTLIKARQEEHERYLKSEPPEFFTLEPGEYLPEPPKHESAVCDASLMRGLGASRGQAVGTVRVIVDPATSAPLRPGDILVAHATDPGWTPLFAVVSAIIVERGGLLSHAAIVAREFGVPAVVAVDGVMERLKDGQTVRVNGDTGEVEILATLAADTP